MFKEKSIKVSHPLNPSAKRAYRRKIPLSEELRKEKLAGSSSSKNDFLSVESLINLVKSEIHLQINKLNLSQIFVKKSEIDALRNFLLSGKEIDFVSPIRKSISGDSSNNSVCEVPTNKNDVTKSGDNTLKLLEQAFIAETGTASSESAAELPIQTTCYNQGEINAPEKISKAVICPSQDRSFFSEQENNIIEPSYIAMKNIEDRLSSVEFKVNSLYKLVEKMASLKKQQIKLQKIRYRSSKSHFTQSQAKNQQPIVNKLDEVELNMHKVFFQSNAVQKGLFDSTKNPYDEKYYEWRQTRKNLLTYKKSLRSISLNRKPKIEQFHPPMAIKNKLMKKNTKAHFLSTPSRTDNKV